jgi:hypothetical protein
MLLMCREALPLLVLKDVELRPVLLLLEGEAPVLPLPMNPEGLPVLPPPLLTQRVRSQFG